MPSKSKGPRNKTRVLVADDNETYRHALLTVLKGVPSLEVIGQAASGDECLRLVATLSPDVVLLDVNMPQLSGIEVTRRLKSGEHPPQVVILSLSDAGDGGAVGRRRRVRSQGRGIDGARAAPHRLPAAPARPQLTRLD